VLYQKRTGSATGISFELIDSQVNDNLA